MSDSEDFLLQINAEELYPDVISPKLQKRQKLREAKKKRKKKKMKISKIVPNHFIAFQIYDAVIRQRIKDFQTKIVKKNPLLNKALIDTRTLHVTLAVTHLKNEENIKELKDALQDWGEKNIKHHFSEPLHLEFKGIGTFRKMVAFAKISECENYKRLCNLSLAVNDLLSKSGFYTENKKNFTPHLTLLKLSRNFKLYREKKNISDDIDILTECEDDFGIQEVKEIQLLSMNSKKDDDGYYKCVWKMKTSQSLPNESLDAPS